MMQYQATFSNLAYLQQPLPLQDATASEPIEPCPSWPSSSNPSIAARFQNQAFQYNLETPSTLLPSPLAPTEPLQHPTLHLAHSNYHDSFPSYGGFDMVERPRFYELNADVSHPFSSTHAEHTIWSDTPPCSPTSPNHEQFLHLGNPLLPRTFLPRCTLDDTLDLSKRHQSSRLTPESPSGLGNSSSALTSPAPESPPADILSSPQFSDDEFVDMASRKTRKTRQKFQGPYVCDICSAVFLRRHDGLRHRRSHTGETPYCCYGCSKGFKRTDARDRHWARDRGCESAHLGRIAGTAEGFARDRRESRKALRKQGRVALSR